jgi:site-specific recombinase XerD
MHDGTAVLVPAVVSRDRDPHDELRWAVDGWLASYPSRTQRNYRVQLKQFFDWCTRERLHPFTLRRPDVERYSRLYLTLELNNMDSTVAHKLSTVHSFYRWCFLEDVIDKDPTANGRRPKLRDDAMRPYLDRMESGRFLATAESSDPRDYALITLLLLNGLRITEALEANIETISTERGHHTMVILGKGRKISTIPLAPRTHRAILAYIGERTSGPIFLGREGNRMNRHAAARTVRRIARKAGIDKRLSPHSMRRSYITVALDSGVPLRDVQHGARHSDPRVTARYDQNRTSLDANPTYVLAAYMGGN